MSPQRNSILLAALGGLAACTQSAVPTARGAGDSLYDGNCSACHQPGGQGISEVYPRLAGSPVVLGDPAALARWVIKGARPASMPAGRYPGAMPLFGWMKPADAAALLTYLRSSFGNHAPTVEAGTVAAALGSQ